MPANGCKCATFRFIFGVFVYKDDRTCRDNTLCISNMLLKRMMRGTETQSMYRLYY
jgi:hypothetical protein